MLERYILEDGKLMIINDHYYDKKIVGGKAYGLLSMPLLWTPTFFVVSKKLYKSYIECVDEFKKQELIDLYVVGIKECMEKLNIQNHDIIIRSSGVSEGMNERGKFESIICSIENLREKLILLISQIAENSPVPNNEMPFVVQKYIAGSITGHLSNEYRFSRDLRDWKYQTECNGEVAELKSLAVRYWREKIDIDSYLEIPLLNHSLKNTLKILASYYTEKKKRFHIEFVYEDNQLYAVQADEDVEIENGVNPTAYDIRMSSKDIKHEFQVLRKVNSNDEAKYEKIRNVAVYHSVGLTTVPLFILDDLNIIQNLSNGIMPKELKEDLILLLNRSIVIRSDISSKNIEERQMLKRSNELRNIDEVQNWLFDHSKSVMDKNGVFIFHNFIPAISAAFAYAKPNTRKVEIQALWGLPEGLYYNAHDTIIVDTKRLCSDEVTPDMISNEDIVEKLQYKGICILPESTGEWKSQKIAKQYNWKCSIQDIDSIKQIAIESRKIADAENEALSIMWFVGIDEQYYHTKNIPWYHEKYTIDSYTNDSYKRKYFSNEEIIIRNEEDIEKLSSSPHARCIRIQPDNDSALRDKNFIKKVGNTAKKYDLMILLEGAVLAHSFYQLINTGANVIVAQGFEEYSEEIEFNKLVRDKIPENILAGGEQVHWAIADDNLYIYLLINKLLEETYEAYDAEGNNTIYELADIYEVCESILDFDTKNIWLIPRNSIPVYYSQTSPENLLSFKHYLDDKEYQNFTIGEYIFCVAVSRKKQFYELELKVVLKNEKHNISRYIGKKDKINIAKLIDLATQTFKSTNLLAIKKVVTRIEKEIIEKCLLDFKVSLDDFKAIKAKKNERNGGFKNKYVLLKTKFSGEETKEEREQCEVLHELIQKTDKTVELLKDGNKKTLLLRKKISMEHITYAEEFISEKINEFFGNDCKITFFFYHEKNKVLFGIKKDDIEVGEQLEFIF